MHENGAYIAGFALTVAIDVVKRLPPEDQDRAYLRQMQQVLDKLAPGEDRQSNLRIFVKERLAALESAED